MPRLFAQRQAAFDTEKMRLQVRDSNNNWLDIHGMFGFSGPSPTPTTWRTDGPNDTVQRFERGKVDQGEMSLDGRLIPIGKGARFMKDLEANGESADFRLWLRGSAITRHGKISGAKLWATIPALTADASITATIAKASGGSDADLAAFELNELAGPNTVLLLGTDGGAKSTSDNNLDDMLVLAVEEVLTKHTMKVSGTTAAATSAGLSNVPFVIARPPVYRQWNGFVMGRSASASQEQAIDTQLTIKVNTAPNDYVDVESSKSELKEIYGAPLG